MQIKTTKFYSFLEKKKGDISPQFYEGTRD